MTPTPRAAGPLSATKPKESLLPPNRPLGQDGRSLSNVTFVSAKPLQSYARGLTAPGSFSSDLRAFSTRNDVIGHGEYDPYSVNATSEQRQAEFRDQIEKETKIKVGTENLLEALNNKGAKQAKEQRKVVEQELNTSNRKLAQLKLDLEAEVQRGREQRPPSPKSRLSQLFRNVSSRFTSDPEQMSGDSDDDEDESETESPTYILAEILQALEVENEESDYYVKQANELVDLFKRHPTLKYDLAWSIFGLRMQMMLLSESREVVAAGYRVIRHSITDRASLQTIRALKTDTLVILSLVKESKARVEREQALKFVRAFLDVKDGSHELDVAVVRVVVAVAEHGDDQLRGIAVLTLAELMIKDSSLAVTCGVIPILSEAMANGTFNAPEALIEPFLHLMDTPAQRNLLTSGFEFGAAFACLTEPILSHKDEARLRASARVVAATFTSWTGLMTLSLHDFLPIRSIVASLYVNNQLVRTTVLDLLIDVLRIKSPSWSTPFIGGRRLTTYGRVTNLKMDPSKPESTESDAIENPHKRSLIRHFTALILAVLIRHGLLVALMSAESDAPNQAIKRRTSLLMTEVLRMASDLLPRNWSQDLQILPKLFNQAANFEDDQRSQAIAAIYQVDSINRTLYRSTRDGSKVQTSWNDVTMSIDAGALRPRAASKTQANANMDETNFRTKVFETGVLNTVNYQKWDWTLIQDLIDGPLTNPKRMQEAITASKFIHRLLGFLRPFKYRFSECLNTKSNQRYVRAACALIKVMLQSSEGVKYLEGNKLVPQIGECLAQQDPMSGITSKTPLFSVAGMNETLAGSYFAILGVLCSDAKGMLILERWKIINIFYHIIDLQDRDDLIRALLANMDYSLDSHPRIMLSKTMIASSKQMRIAATKILRKYALQPLDSASVGGGAAEWALKLLVGQLYDPDIEICEVAIKILEEACDSTISLEYVVRCRPALDHLGEIGAPLLLRFLSTSIGYHYLDGLDYITKEMDDWFLGRNDAYVAVVETTLARALTVPSETRARSATEDEIPIRDLGFVPPHFYRELTRTAEGCRLLQAKGHFEEFALTIHEFADEAVDPEIILKLKGCLWAVGNVGSMERGAPFLEQTGVVEDVVKIAETSQVMTLRGTAFFTLGLISRSLHGQEILIELGWDGNVNVMGASLGYVLPTNLTRIFMVKHDATNVSCRLAAQNRQHDVAKEPQSSDEQALLQAVVKLGNTVLTNPALAELTRLRNANAPGLRQAKTFLRVMKVLSHHSYRLPQYRFVIDLFDKEVLRRIVLHEEGDECDGEERSREGNRTDTRDAANSAHNASDGLVDRRAESESDDENDGESE